MNISAKTEYACLAVLELSSRYGSGKPVRIREIADCNGIPARFLVQILLQLKAAGIVDSTRGAAGGYQLLRDPAEISLAEVMAVINGELSDPIRSAVSESSHSRALLSIWSEVADQERKLLESLTFADLLEQSRGQSEMMYYI